MSCIVDCIACSIEYMCSYGKHIFYLYSWSRSGADVPTSDLDSYTCIWSKYVDHLCSYHVNVFTIVCAKVKTKDVGMVVPNKCSM